MTQIKNCRTCAHCDIDNFWGPYGDWCILGGEKCRTMRINPEKPCDINFSGWAPRTTIQYLMDNRFAIAIGSILIFIVISAILNHS